MADIFVSYRRSDSIWPTGRICDHLTMEFGNSNVFLDSRTVRGGDDFIDSIEESVARCNVMLVIIGGTWLEELSERTEKQRLEKLSENLDFVRFEIAEALRLGIHVIPILIDNTPSPSRGDLPPDLELLARRQAMKIRANDFANDLTELLTIVRQKLAEANTRANGQFANDDPVEFGPEFGTLRSIYSQTEIEFPHLRDITFAMWALESGYGRSQLAVEHKNFAGMKWHEGLDRYASKILYRPAHAPVGAAFFRFESHEDFIKGFWLRLDIASLPYSKEGGGWRKHVSNSDQFINFIGAFWAPETSTPDTSRDNMYSKKVKELYRRLKNANALPSSSDIQ